MATWNCTSSPTWSFSYLISRSPHHHPKGQLPQLIPILQMQRLSLKETKALSLGHTATKRQSQDPDLGWAVTSGCLRGG